MASETITGYHQVLHYAPCETDKRQNNDKCNKTTVNFFRTTILRNTSEQLLMQKARNKLT